jgi:capsular exopolysaccharide synthesis family protein
MEQRSSAELRQYVSIVLKWWWLILIVTLVSGISAYLVSQASPKTYQSKATLMVGTFTGPTNPDPTTFNVMETLAQNYADIAIREPVLRGAIDQLQLGWDPNLLKSMVTARVVPNSALLELSVVDSDPHRARALVQEITNQLIKLTPGSDAQREAERQSILTEIEDIKNNINLSRQELLKLNDEIAKASSQRQAQEARSRQRTLQEQIQTWQNTYASLLSSLGVNAPNVLTVLEKPIVPTTPVGPRILENTLLAAAIGFVVAAAAALLIESLDDTVKNQDDVRTLLNLAPMGIITRIETGEDYPDKLVVSKFPLSSAAEAYRILRTNLQFKMVERSIRSLMVTSTQPMEGKSVTAANLAAVLAQSGKKVILVDADLRRPTQHRVFEMSNSTGLTGALLDEKTHLNEFMREDIIDNLNVMSSGPLPPNPSELLGSKRMSDLILQLQELCDIVIFDTAPVMSVADATALAGHVDGVLLVVDSGHTRRKMARMSYEALTAVGANVLGVVLNRVSRRGKDASYSYYYPQRKENEQQAAKGKQKKANAGLFGKKESRPVPTPSFTQAQSPAPAVNGSAKKAIERQGS